MTRVCFQLRVAPELIPEYRARHEAVWPDMLREIERAGRRNYSLFLAPDGLLVGYYEVDSVHEADRHLAQSEVAASWERHMGDLFRTSDGTIPAGRADQHAAELDEVFHLEDQLARLTPPTRFPHQGESA